MNQRIDWPSFSASIAVILAVSVPLILFPESGGAFLTGLYGKVTTYFGFVYLMSGLAVLIFLAWLAFGPYG